MVEIHCRARHVRPGGALCPACAELTGYAELRLSKCPFGAAKTTCRECPVHCYRPGEREAMKDVNGALVGGASLQISWVSSAEVAGLGSTAAIVCGASFVVFSEATKRCQSANPITATSSENTSPNNLVTADMQSTPGPFDAGGQAGRTSQAVRIMNFMARMYSRPHLF